jgi:hypothetical protein
MKTFLFLLITAFFACQNTICGQPKLQIAYATQFYDGDTPIPSDSVTLSYNANKQENGLVTWSSFSGDSLKQASRQTNYVYNAQGTLLEWWYESGNDLDGWVPQSRTITTYNDQQQPLTEVKEAFDGNSWQTSSVVLWEYDANNRLLFQIQGNYRYYYQYDTLGLLYSIEDQNFIGGTWRSERLYRYYFHPGDSLVDVIELSRWTGQWELSIQVEYAYHASGKIQEQTTRYQIWDEWINYERQIYTFNALAQPLQRVYHYWNNFEWKPELRTSTYYDADNDPIREVSERWENDSWQKYHLIRRHYQLSTDVSLLPSLNVELFPNPATDQVILRGQYLTQVRIFDQQGKLIQNTPLTEQPQAVLSTAHLPEGRYMIQVVDTHHNTCVKPLVVTH